MQEPQNPENRYPTVFVSLIENCPMALECREKWETLTATANPIVRHCGVCGKDVTFCANSEKLEQMKGTGQCVAFHTRRQNRPATVMGLPSTGRSAPNKGDSAPGLRSFIDSL